MENDERQTVSDPCEQKESITKLFLFHDQNLSRLHELEKRQLEIQGDVKYIRTRIDNGMSHTIENLNTLMMRLEPVIEYHSKFIEKAEVEEIPAKCKHHTKVVDNIENIGWWLSKLVLFALLISLVGVIIWAIANGWKPS